MPTSTTSILLLAAFAPAALAYTRMPAAAAFPRAATASRGSRVHCSEVVCDGDSCMVCDGDACTFAGGPVGAYPPSPPPALSARHDIYPYNAAMPPPRAGMPAAHHQQQYAAPADSIPARRAVEPIGCHEEYQAVMAQAAAADRLVVVKVHAKYCRACKMLAPRYSKLAAKYAGHAHVEFRTISYEENKEFCETVLGITQLPTTQVLFPGRNYAESIVEGASIGKLEGSLMRHVSFMGYGEEYGM